MRARFLTVLLLVGVASLAFMTAACSRGSDSVTAAGSAGPPVTEVNIALTDSSIQPAHVTVPVGQPVTFHVTNTGLAVHNLHIFRGSTTGNGYIDKALESQQESTFVFTFTKRGTAKLQCDMHSQLMVGLVTVE